MSFCFATMAVGNEYIMLALKLICDIKKYFPDTSIYVLTDSPHLFNNQGVETVIFRKTGYWYLYHEKQQAILAASKKHSHCLFLDADCRLLERPPIEEYLQLSDGLYGAYAQNFNFKFDAEINSYQGKERWFKNTPKRRKKLLLQYCNQLDIEFASCSFLQEACLLVAGKQAFDLLPLWNYMGRDLSSRVFEWGEGFVYGLSASYLKIEAAGLPNVIDWMFKDNLVPSEKLNSPQYQKLIQERKAIHDENRNKKNKRLIRFYGLVRFAIYAPIWHLFQKQIAVRKILNKKLLAQTY